MTNLKFDDLPKATEEIIRKLLIIEEELQLIKLNLQPKENEELMTRRETADFLKVSLTALWDWNKKGILPNYGIGNKVYYKRSEVLSRLTKIV